eukprot:241578-Alexandrium_andersonii.AAC.1
MPAPRRVGTAGHRCFNLRSLDHGRAWLDCFRQRRTANTPRAPRPGQPSQLRVGAWARAALRRCRAACGEGVA